MKLVEEADAPVIMHRGDIEKRAARLHDWKAVLDAGLISALYVPLRWRDEIIGSIDFRSKVENAYSEVEFRIATLIADQVVGMIANSVLHEDLAQSEAEQTQLAELGRRVSEFSNPTQVFEVVDETLRGFLDFDRISINRLEINPLSMVLRYQNGIQIEGNEIGSHIPIEGGIDDYLEWATQPPTERPRYYQSPMTQAFTDLGLNSTMRAPMKTGDHFVGVIAVFAKRSDAFTENDYRLLTRLADQVAAIVDNLDLIANAERRAKEQSELALLARDLSSASTREEMFRLADVVSSGFLGSDRISISILDAETMKLTIAFERGVEIPEVSVGSVFKIGSSQEEFNSWATALSSPIPNYLNTTMSGRSTLVGLKTTMRAPLRTTSGTIGVIAVNSYAPNAYSTHDHELLELIAAQLAPALENVALYQTAQDEAQERTVLAEIGRIANSSLSLEDSYEELAEKVSEMMSYDRMSVGTIDRSAGTFEQSFVTGVGADQTPLGIPSPLDDSLIQRRGRDNGILIEDIDSDQSAIGQALRPLGLRSAMSAPIISQGEILAILSLSSLKPSFYGVADLESLRSIAVQIGGAIANSRYHTRSLQLADEREERVRLDAQNRELQEIERERANFISTISHELRTPLTSVSAFSDLLSRNTTGNLDDRQLRQIDLVKKNAKRLGIIIDDLFDVTRINAGTFEVLPDEFDVTQLMSEIHQSMQPIVLEKNQRLNLEVPDGELWISGDRDRIAQVTTNLLSNASKYSPDDTAITLRLLKKKNDLLIEVQDQGIGISKRDQRLLYTPFFRADNEATRSVDGTGLGLMVTQKIVELHNGTISVKSKLGKGSTFTVMLPAVQSGPSDDYLSREAEREQGPVPHSRLDDLPSTSTSPGTAHSNAN